MARNFNWMTKAQRLNRYLTVAVVVTPLLGFVYAVTTLWGRGVDAVDLSILLFLYFVSGFGVTIGFHRMLTHRSFETSPLMRAALASAGSLALEGPPIRWVADHRQHHDLTDIEGDPHSPHAGHGGDFLGTLKGLWHAHVGWLFAEREISAKRYAPDLVRDSLIRRVDKSFPMIALATLALPFLIGLAIKGTLAGALSALLWGGLVRIFITHHVTWSVNSICHMYGRREFDIDDKSTNNWLLALPTFGEAWHHNHHAFPTSAFHGIKRWQAWLDPTGWVIRAWEKVGLVWNVRRVSEKQIASKLPGAGDNEGAIVEQARAA